MQTLIAFLVALTILIFVHEMGHYLAARWFDVKVLRFSIGFGKRLLTWKVGPDQTEWSVSALPLGGYVKMLNTSEYSDPAQVAADEQARAFDKQSLGARSIIVLAGPFANFLLAAVFYAMLGGIGVTEPSPILNQPAQNTPAQRAGIAAGDRVLAIDGNRVRSWNEVRLHLFEGAIERRSIPVQIERNGEQLGLELDASGLPEGAVEGPFLDKLGIQVQPLKVVLGDILADSAAAASGLKPGDEIARINNEPITGVRQLVDVIRQSPGRSLSIDVIRSGQPVSLTVTPRAVVSERPADNGREVGRIGAKLSNRLATEIVQYGPVESVMFGLRKTWDMTLFTFRMFGKMLIGDLSIKNISGPVTIADVAGQTSKVGWFAYLNFLAIVSISLGVLNLLPIPVLDGGHLVYYALEAIKGKPLSDRFMQVTQYAGVGAIMLLMFVALFNDITRLIGS